MALNIPVDMIKVDIGEFTADVSRDDIEHIVSGSGIFDTLMETATEHLKAQFEGNRIREEDYALAYIEIYKATLQAALQAWLQKGVAEAEIISKLADIPLKEKQLEIAEADLALKNAELPLKEEQLRLLKEQLKLLQAQAETEKGKAALYLRQIESFDESYKEKVLKMMLETWGVGFSVANDAFETVPQPMTHTAIDGVFKNYILPDLERYKYSRPVNTNVVGKEEIDEMLKEFTTSK